MTFYCIRPRGWVGLASRPVDTGPNPYDPASHRFAERHRQTETVLPDGTVRIDMGGTVDALKLAAAQPEPSNPVDAITSHRPPTVAPPRPRKDPWGINRDDL